MAGETAKTKAICLSINPWSQTSHIVSWLTPEGKLTTAVKGAVRPKSAFLGQYDLNYVCEIVYYLNAKSDIHALRECAPLKLNDFLRSDYRKLLVAEHFRTIASTLAPQGPDANEWFNLL
ncbi:MAG: recombination protein O N-terminal domain-containing protein, partial [Kiritimatiellae bacterium]|nr:recombination protein O N-terminal domain-containing protein [Kiritimatiellia bacterium]